jgi:hypothetical protein
LRAIFPDVAITVEGSKFLPEEANSQRTPRVAGWKLLRTSSYCADYRGYGSVAQIRGALVGAARWRYDFAKGQKIAG